MAEKNLIAETSRFIVISQGEQFSKNSQYITLRQTETSSIRHVKQVVENDIEGSNVIEEDLEYIVN